jgi:hypothetical protein
MILGNALQALGDPLQWVIIGVLGVVVVVVIVYLLLRIIRTLNKADKYFDSKGNQPSLDKDTKSAVQPPT